MTDRRTHQHWSEERDSSDAPVWLDAEAASAWAAGWNAAVVACSDELRSRLEREGRALGVQL